MIDFVDTILALVLLSVLFSFGTSRLPALIKIIAFQGVAVSIVPLFIGHELTTGGTVFTLVTLLIRGIIIHPITMVKKADAIYYDAPVSSPTPMLF